MDEFGFLKNLKKHFNFRKIGDDCAVLPTGPSGDLLLTADLLVQDIDFRFGWMDAQSLGHKTLAVSLSDIAAMGGVAKWSLISIAAQAEHFESGLFEGFFEGAKRLADSFGVEIVGGDLSGTSGPITIDSIAAGMCTDGRAVLRSGARPGDLVWVSGPLGGASAGLYLLESGLDLQLCGPGAAKLMKRQLKPSPKLELGKVLQERGLATAMIDISDGLSSDLGHICDQSRVGARIDESAIPVEAALSELASTEAPNLPSSPVSFALNGGEDFELLFTSAKESSEEIEALGCFRIGEITGTSGKMTLAAGNDERLLVRGGFRHFG